MRKVVCIILLSVFETLNLSSAPYMLDTVYVDAPSQQMEFLEVKNVNGGKMFFIPDSLTSQVESVLEGYSKIVRDDSKVDPNEKVIVNGDTVNLIIKDKNLGRFDRGLFNYIYIPKGSWHFGLTASYGEFNSDDLQVLDLLTDFDFTGHTFSIKPSVSYFIKNNLSVGMRLGYTSSKATLGSMVVDFDEDLNFDISDVYYRNESYTAALTLRHYIGLSRGGRFGVFNEVELAFSSGNGDFRRKYNREPKNTHMTSMDARINFSPGLCVFIMKNVSFNISFGVFGYYLKNEKQITDGVESGNRFTSGANFKFNLFNINFGLGVHI